METKYLFGLFKTLKWDFGIMFTFAWTFSISWIKTGKPKFNISKCGFSIPFKDHELHFFTQLC